MYHGREVPGFPVHPHRGFETVTIVRKGYVDHADSLGAAGRYGEGDVQWMTAGDGVQHSEMFPLLKKDEGNTVELFQIWLNLPRRNKRVPPHFKMFWSETIPRVLNEANKSEVSVIAGDFEGKTGLPPPPDSWAHDPSNDVAILLIKLAGGGRLRLPPARAKASRVLYFFKGEGLRIDGQGVGPGTGHRVNAEKELQLDSGSSEVEILLLQACPIGEPVVQHGPFVMNSREEIQQAIRDFQVTEFGGWPWERDDMVHGSEIRRFARYPGGRMETPPAS
jgi:redox-sensitive bicupin YhaK (pirin superfamily)